jgi:hypothetical protein
MLTICPVRRYAFAMLAKKLGPALLAVVVIFSHALLAQQAPVTISVKDPSGAGIPHAHVRIVPVPDPAPKMETDDGGKIKLTLKTGGYELLVQSQGFKQSVTHFDVGGTKDAQNVAVILQVGSYSGPEVTEVLAMDTLVLKVQPFPEPAKLSVSDLKAWPHITTTIHNSHTNADETYSGVRLADLLHKFGAPLGDELRGPALANYIVATGSDGYQVVLALAEVDPGFHPGEVIVADAMNSKPLDDHSGPFKLVVAEDKRPARSVRNLVGVELRSAH